MNNKYANSQLKLSIKENNPKHQTVTQFVVFVDEIKCFYLVKSRTINHKNMTYNEKLCVFSDVLIQSCNVACCEFHDINKWEMG